MDGIAVGNFRKFFDFVSQGGSAPRCPAIIAPSSLDPFS